MDIKALSLSFAHKGRFVTLHGAATPKLQVTLARQLARELKKESAIYALNVSSPQECGIPHFRNGDMQKMHQEFADVFVDMPTHLPPRRDVDHVLEPGSKPINKALYCLSKVEWKKISNTGARIA